MNRLLKHVQEQAPRHATPMLRFGRVHSVTGLLIEATGLKAGVGELCYIYEDAQHSDRKIRAEVVGVRQGVSLLMPLNDPVGLRAGCWVRKTSRPLTIKVGSGLLGRIIDGNGAPLDGKGPLLLQEEQPVHNAPLSPLERRLIEEPLYTGVRAIDTFLTLGKGQRVGIFAGSGVGKSTLMSMIARNSSADINVIALIGERGREVQEFIVDNLGEEGLARSVVVAVTGDQAALNRVKGASIATAIAEYFRDQGHDVLLMMDSVTRVAMAQREIGLATGEPPTTRGYPPSVFALLPRLLERGGSNQHGTITGIDTVLVDGDDFNEPIGDAVRGILDGHIVLSRKLAHANHFPAIDILQSVSRVMSRIVPREVLELVGEARSLLATYREAEDLIRIGAYKPGQDPQLDRALQVIDELNAFLRQGQHEVGEREPWKRLKAILERSHSG